MDVKALATMLGWGYSTAETTEKLQAEGYLVDRTNAAVSAKLSEIRNYLAKRTAGMSETQLNFMKMALRGSKPVNIMKYAPENLKEETKMKAIDTAIANNEFANVEIAAPVAENTEVAERPFDEPVVNHLPENVDEDTMGQMIHDLFFGRETAPIPNDKMMKKYIKVARKTGVRAIEVHPGAIVFHIQ